MTAFEGQHVQNVLSETLEFASNYSEPGLVMLFLVLRAVDAEANMHAHLLGFSAHQFGHTFCRRQSFLPFS
jgi:hypothetical protein